MTYQYLNFKRVYLTGCDCAGKSSLARSLSDASGLKITKFSKPENRMQHLKEMLKFQDIAENSKKNCILDRAWNGRFCYHGILEQWSAGTGKDRALEDCMELSKKFTDNGGAIILVYADYDETLRRLKLRGDEFISKDAIGAVLNRYRVLRQEMQKRKIPFYFFDTSSS